MALTSQSRQGASRNSNFPELDLLGECNIVIQVFLLWYLGWGTIKQRIKLRTEAVASVVNFRTVQNFCPVWSEGVGSTCRKCGSAKNNWFDEETHEVKEIWAALKFTTLATASVLS